MVSYPALFDPDPHAGGFVVTFPDFTYGVTQGETVQEAQEMASDLLACLISDLIKEGKPLPKPGKPRGRHYRLVSLPVLQGIKAELYTAFLGSGIKKTELARRLGIAKTNVDRLFDFRNRTRLDQLEAAFAVLGKRLSVEVETPAA
jgi:antitoxin HicB